MSDTTQLIETAIHFDEDAEKAVILGLIMSEHYRKIFSEITTDDFYTIAAREEFEKLHKSFTAGTFIESRKTSNPTSWMGGGMALFDAVKVVRNHAIRRRMTETAVEIIDATKQYTKSIDETLELYREKSKEIQDPRVAPVPTVTTDDTAAFRDELKNATPEFFTGIDYVDKHAVISAGDFVILAARPGVGKTAFLTGAILENTLVHRKNGIYFCLEMDRRQTYARIITQLTGIPLSAIMYRYKRLPADDKKEIENTLKMIEKNFPKRWLKVGRIKLNDIRRVVEVQRPDWIMIDYVQIINHRSKFGPVVRLDEISTELRQLALDFNIPVVVAAQLNRDTQNAKPTIANIKGSGQFEQDATHIFLLDRPEGESAANGVYIDRKYVNRQGLTVPLTDANHRTNRAALLCSKNRNGATFLELLEFIPELLRFATLPRIDASDVQE